MDVTFYVQLRSIQGCQKVFKQQADNEQQAALELAPKAQVLEGQRIQGHSEIYRFGNSISRGFQLEKFFTADAMLFYQNTPKTRNNAVEMSQVFHDIACFKCFMYLNLLEYAFSVIQNQERDALQFYSMVLIFLSAVMVEGDESSRLRMANQLAVLAGYWPLLTAPSIMYWYILQTSQTSQINIFMNNILFKQWTWGS